jgi:hypothetical protein
MALFYGLRRCLSVRKKLGKNERKVRKKLARTAFVTHLCALNLGLDSAKFEENQRVYSGFSPRLRCRKGSYEKLLSRFDPGWNRDLGAR